MVYNQDYIAYKRGLTFIVEFKGDYLPSGFFANCRDLGYTVLKTYDIMGFPFIVEGMTKNEFETILSLCEA